ncbi:MAG: hypothetical protein N2449_09340 [Bacteroidales bacterium]|nr:hypothetical protein [Bacteroidales bacterium]
MKAIVFILCFLFFQKIFSQEDMLVLPIKHSSYITKFIYTYDKRYIFTASKDKTIKLWYFNGALLIRTYYGHQNDITDMAVDKSSTTLFSADKSGFLFVWNVNTNEIIQKIKCDYPITSILLNESENLLLIATENGSIEFYNTKLWNKIKSISTKPYYPIKILPSKIKENYFLGLNKLTQSDDQTSLDKGNVQMLDTRLEKFFPLSTYTDDLVDINLSPDSSKIVTVSKENNMARIWDTNKLIEENSFRISIKPKTVFIARNNKMIGIGSATNSEVRGYRNTGEEVLSFSIDTGFTIYGEFNKDITRIHVLNNFGQYKVFDFEGNVRHIFGYYATVSHQIVASAYSTKDKVIALGYDHGKTLIFNLLKQTIETITDTLHSSVQAIAFDNKNPWISITYQPIYSSISDENTSSKTLSLFTIYDFEKHNVLFRKEYTDTYITAIECAQSLAFLGFNSGDMEIWDIEQKKLLRKITIAPYDLIKIIHDQQKIFIQTINNQLLIFQLTNDFNIKLIKTLRLANNENIYDAKHDYVLTNLHKLNWQNENKSSITSEFSLLLNSTESVLIDTNKLKLLKGNSTIWTTSLSSDKPQNIFADTSAAFLSVVYPFSRISFYNTRTGEQIGDLFLSDFSTWIFTNKLNFDASETALPKINIVKGIVYNRNVNKDELRIKGLLLKSLNLNSP